MTDTYNQDSNYSVHFDFFIEPHTHQQEHKSITAQINMDGRSWEVNTADLKPIPKKQLVFSAKSGSLFR